MSTLLGRLVWALLLVCAMSSRAFADISVDVRLRFNDPRPAAALVESLEREAAAIWKTYGVQLRWRAAPLDGEGGTMSFEVLIDSHRRQASGGREVLGDTRLPLQGIDHVPIRLDREATELLLRSVSFDQLARFAHHASIAPRDVGHALGRVLAHELGHAFLGTRDHQARGLMRASFSGEELLTGERATYGLSEAEVVRLRREIRRRTEMGRAERDSEDGTET